MPDERRPDTEERIDDLALEALAESAATAPPAALRERVLADAVRESEAAALPRRLVRWRLAGVGALAASAVLAVLLATERSGSREAREALALAERDRSGLAAALDERESEIRGLRETLAVQAEIVRALSGPRVLSAGLAPTEAAPAGGQARVVVASGSGRVYVIGRGLPALPEDRTYALWAIRGASAPEPAGLFAPASVDAFTSPLSQLERPEEVTAFAVSVEPAGGSPSPTGPVVLVGAVGA